MNVLYSFFCGLLIGVCDLVPGISGGTMALMLGIYEPLMHAIADVRNRSFKNIWFLLALLLGVGCSLLAFSSVFHALIQQEAKRGYLYSLFFGLVGGSSWVVAKGIPQWSVSTIFLLIGGAFAAFLVTHMPVLMQTPAGFSFYLWLFVAGALAVFAMLLPGISGSYVLMVLGPYPLVIESLSRLSKQWDGASLKVLLPLGCGILIGAAFFSRAISLALKQYKTVTLSLLLGFMLGASTAVWPYSTVPSMDVHCGISLLLMLAGVLGVIALEAMAMKRNRHEL